jgi:hypothetical protein
MPQYRGESRKQWLNKCIPVVRKEGTAKDSSQAAAICHSMYRRAKKKSRVKKARRK